MIRQPTATLSAKQERVALLIAAGRAIRTAAAECGVAERTAHHWLDEPAFRAKIASLRDRMLSESLGRLTEAATGAADVLRGLLASESESIRLAAARAILDSMVRLREHSELAGRVAALEQLASEEQQRLARGYKR